MGVAYERFIEAAQSHGLKIQHHGKDRARMPCPGHGGEDQNLSVAVGDQGVLLKCQSYDCPAEDIAKGLGLTLNDLFDSDGRATYDYGGGHRVMRRRTRDGKSIVQQHKPAVTSLYRHPESPSIEDSPLVVLVEGEKCVDAMIRLGETAAVTTWPGGANGVGQVDLSPLAGKYVRIIADNDPPGHKAARELIQRLSGIATVEGVWIVPGEKESVDDVWVRGGSLSELVAFTPPAPEPEEDEGPSRGLALRPLSTVSSKRTRFLWEKMIPQSAVSIAAGRGGTGKSSFLIWLAAQINRGALPGELHGQRSSVLYVSHEDSLDEVVTPRADANGVDRELFYSLGIQSKEVGGVVVPRLPEDMPIIRQAIEQTGAKLLIIDPITSTLAGGDNDKMADVRLVMDPLNAMAAELGVSVIGIAHFRKGGGNQADLISGSHAWRDAARCVILFARDEEADCTVMTLDKINSGEAGKSFKYRLDIVQQMTDEGALTDVGKVVWEGDSTNSVGDIINHESEAKRQGGLGNDLLDYINSFQGRAVSANDCVQHFAIDGTKPDTVRKTLKRMATRGVIDQPEYGHYQANQDTLARARARGGVQGVQPVQPVDNSGSYPQVSTEVGQVGQVGHPHAGAREADTLCRGCGYPLPTALVLAGEPKHQTC